jgi:hypothetical protein
MFQKYFIAQTDTKDSTNKFYGLQNLAEDEALNIHEIENKLTNQGGN